MFVCLYYGRQPKKWSLELIIFLSNDRYLSDMFLHTMKSKYQKCFGNIKIHNITSCNKVNTVVSDN